MREYNSAMGIGWFKEQLKGGVWKGGGIWEFDWYIDLFFVEEMSYGKNPFHLGYMQPIIGDLLPDYNKSGEVKERLKKKYWNLKGLAEFTGLCKNVVDKAERLLTTIKVNKNIDLNEYELAQRRLSLLMATVSAGIDQLATEYVKEFCGKNNFSEDDVSGHITAKSLKTKLSESNEKLRGIYKKYGNTRATGALKRHAANYGWINTGERGAREWTGQDFFEQMRELASAPKERNEPAKDIDDEIIKKVVEINSLDNKAADLQAELDFQFQQYLRRKLGGRYIEGILENMSFDEITRVIKDPKKISEYESRFNNRKRAAWPENGQVYIYNFSSEKEYNQLLNLVSKKPPSNKIAGLIACKGFVQGRARVIKSQDDLLKFEKGEIMVAYKTQPKYTPYMVRAAAMVTNIGGITSHAAIVAREFSIPCIVGTENATEMIKTGQIITVDANTGNIYVNREA